jgi:hypothetical protein
VGAKVAVDDLNHAGNSRRSTRVKIASGAAPSLMARRHGVRGGSDGSTSGGQRRDPPEDIPEIPWCILFHSKLSDEACSTTTI